MGENELGQGLAHMMAAPPVADEGRRHISDAAIAAMQLSEMVGEAYEGHLEACGTVVITVAEHDELQQAVWRLDGDKLMLEAERDSLRSEVERLKRSSIATEDAYMELRGALNEANNEIERLRKGRDDDAGAEMPAPYKIIGYGGKVIDYSKVNFPQKPAADCAACHVEGTNAPANADLFKADLSNQACIGCHTEKPSAHHTKTDCVSCHNETKRSALGLDNETKLLFSCLS